MRYMNRVSVLVGLAVVFLAVPASVAEDAPSLVTVPAAIAAQSAHCDRLMAIPDVIGTAVELDELGQPAILVLAERAGATGIPLQLDGVPVRVEVTGPLYALPPAPAHTPRARNGQVRVATTGRYPRPVPIGVSTGNINECAAGTIGARVTDGANVYALSNNHVYARENLAALGEAVVQPGNFDTNCVADQNNAIGTLAAFEPLAFNSNATETVDAAIALSSTANLKKSTPGDGYGTPSKTIATAFVGQRVKKYGRTTRLTKGKVMAIHATVEVGYSSGTVLFENQILVKQRKDPFVQPGDSGSLVVTDNARRNPVGLLFAGTEAGDIGVANPIGLVLERFGVTIDGK